MTAFHDEVDWVRDQFREGLAAAGFNVSTPAFASGEIDVPSMDPVDIDITIPDDFPYVPPKVRPTLGVGGRSWHRDYDGSLCIYASDDPAEPTWGDVEAFLDRVRDWFIEDAAGWPNDTTDLDLDRYWPNNKGLVLFGDIEWTIDQSLRAVHEPGHEVPRFRISAGTAAGGKRRSRRLGVRALDVGELAEPVHDWSELAEVLPEVDQVEAMIRTRQVRMLLVRYWRGGHAGVVALLVSSHDPIEFVALSSADTTTSAARLRAGSDASILADKSVAIIGVGAVGSLVADGLARAGIGALTLVDGDIVRPGNLVRHLLTDPGMVGDPKATAVAEHLRNAPWAPERVTDLPGQLTSADAAVALFDSHDLVIDATASGRGTAILLDASRTLGRPALSVCVLRDGGIIRVDRHPLASTETALGPVPPSPTPQTPLRERGCGTPISPTPPWACASAASLAVAVAVDLLTGRHQYGPTIEQVLVAQLDAPYDTVGTRQ